MITKITEAVEKSASEAMFKNVVFDEFTLLENNENNICFDYIIEATIIEMPDGYSVTIDAREDPHNDRGGKQPDAQHRGRIKVSFEGKPKSGITFPVDYKRGGVRADLIPTKLDKFKPSIISKSYDVACAISAYAKDEIKTQAKFPTLKNEKKLEDRLERFNELSDEEKERYLEKGKIMSKKDTTGKSKIKI